MSDKLSEVYECYDMTIISTGKGRGMNIVKTDRGIRVLQPLMMSESRLEQEALFKEQIVNAGYVNVDVYIRNRDGEYVTYDRYHTPYVLKEYFEGKECNIRAESDMVKAVDNLADLHLALDSMGLSRSVKETTREGKQECKTLYTFERRNRELQRVQRFMRKKSARSEFEYLYLSCFNRYYQQGRQVYLEMQADQALADFEKLTYCHGAYNQHNVLFLKNDMATVNFDHFTIDHPLTDLYTFLRKAMEKNEYQTDLLQRLMDTYTLKIPFSGPDYKLLYYLFLYPEKFWKISNQYNNMNKAWIAPKMMEKLHSLLEIESKKQEMLTVYYKQYC